RVSSRKTDRRNERRRSSRSPGANLASRLAASSTPRGDLHGSSVFMAALLRLDRRDSAAARGLRIGLVPESGTRRYNLHNNDRGNDHGKGPVYSCVMSILLFTPPLP